MTALYYILVDPFNQVLGDTYTDLENAEAAIVELGVDAGDVTVVQSTRPLPDMSDITEHSETLTGKKWEYDSVSESFVTVKLDPTQ